MSHGTEHRQIILPQAGRRGRRPLHRIFYTSASRERAQKSADLCFSALASCTVVLRRAEKQAPYNFRGALLVNNFLCPIIGVHTRKILSVRQRR